jgi:hypothetical protein
MTSDDDADLARTIALSIQEAEQAKAAQSSHASSSAGRSTGTKKTKVAEKEKPRKARH